MSSRRSIIHPRVDDVISSSPTSSSPLRRRSRILQLSTPPILAENNDEEELLVRRLESSPSQAPRAAETRRSLGIGFVTQMSATQLAEKIRQCIQLNAENKINVKNAFSLQMIDFMSYMIKKKSGLEDLGVASTTLDVSTKIYGFRVDGLHLGITKMSSRNDVNKNDDAMENENLQTGDNEREAQVRTKKKRKNKQKIILDPESLRGPIETYNPSLGMMALDDAQTTDKLYMATLPYNANHGSRLNLYDHAVLETVSPEIEGNLASISIPKIDLENVNSGNSTFGNFDLLGWSVNDEAELIEPDEPINAENGYQFDLDASLPPETEPPNAGVSLFDIEEQEVIERCERVAQAPANVVDFTNILQNASRNRNYEYSYLEKMDICWAGPSHWKIRLPPNNRSNNGVVGRCEHTPARRRRELLLAYTDESADAAEANFAIARGNTLRLQTKTTNIAWTDGRITMPQDMHYSVADICKFYGRPEVSIHFPRVEDVANATHIGNEIGDYDYNNEHDTTDYCPNIQCDEQPDVPANISDNQPSNETDIRENLEFSIRAFTGDNLVEIPRLTQPIALAHSIRAKKINMRQLKECIWKNLTKSNETNEEENNNFEEPREPRNNDRIHGTVTFSKVFEELPKTLSKNNTEALTLPLAFTSLLHLANEKDLKLHTNEDRSDIFVQQMNDSE